MTAVQIIGLAIRASIFLLVFAIGLQATMQDIGCLFRRPGLLVRSIVSMNIVMPALAVAVALLFHFDPALKIALVALAISPVPPILPNRLARIGGSHDYGIALLAVAAAATVILLPIAIAVVGQIFGRTLHVPEGKVLPVVLLTVFVPLFTGVLTRRFLPDFAARAARPIAMVAMLLLVAACLPIFFVAGKPMWALVGNGSLVCIALFTVAGLATGHYLGGPNPGDRTVLALATALRHPGVALTIASINFPDHRMAVAAGIVLYLLTAVVITIPYARWRAHRHAMAEAANAVHDADPGRSDRIPSSQRAPERVQ